MTIEEELKALEKRKLALKQKVTTDEGLRVAEAMRRVADFVTKAVDSQVFRIDEQLRAEIAAAGVEVTVSFNHREYNWVPDESGARDDFGRPIMKSIYWRSPVHVTVYAQVETSGTGIYGSGNDFRSAFLDAMQKFAGYFEARRDHG
jgi:hypothetical protein